MHVVRPWLIATLLLSLSCSVAAHDLWVERQDGQFVLAYGHEHSGHGGKERLAYQPRHVEQAVCVDAAGRPRPATLQSGYPVGLRGDCAATWFLLSSGYWSKTPHGTRNVPKTEAGPVLSSWLSVESVKRVDAWGQGLSAPLTRELELVPLADPLSVRPGGKLKVAVYRDGRPAPGVTVAYLGHPRGVTGADGSVNIRLKQPGYQLIQASLELPLRDGKADKAIHATALAFELAP